MIGPFTLKNWCLTFCGDVFSDTEFGSLFSLLAVAIYGILGDLLGFLVQSPAAYHVRNSANWLTPIRKSTASWERCGGQPYPDQSGNPDSNLGSRLADVSAKWLALAEVCCLRAYLHHAFSRQSNVLSRLWSEESQRTRSKGQGIYRKV